MVTTEDKMVIFDFDGVLVDSISIAIEVLKSIEPELTEDDFKQRFHGNYYEHKAETNFDPKKFYAAYIPRVEKLLIRPEIVKTVEQLEHRHRLHIVSSTREDIIENILSINKLRSSFEKVLGSDTHRSKVVKFRSLLNAYELPPTQAVLITDTLGDIREANEVGLASIGALWGLHDQATLEKGNPRLCVTTPADIPLAVEQVIG